MDNVDGLIAAFENSSLDGAVTQKPLFQLGSFTLNSGAKSFFKIDADALTANDIECLARLAVDRVPPFGKVVGVPRGGLRLAAALAQYCRPHCPRVLIADDVYTTGNSLRRMASQVQRDLKCASEHIYGIVIFARESVEHPWVRVLFQLSAPTHE